MKSIFDKLVMMCDEIMNTSKTASVYSIEISDYRFNSTIFLVVICLFLLIVIAINFYYFYKKYQLKGQIILTY